MSEKREIDDLIPAFAIGATDAEEAMQIKQYLAENPTAAAELAAYSQLADSLLFAVPMVEAPVDSGARLLAAINLAADNTLADSPKVERTIPTAVRPNPAGKRTEPREGWWKKIFGPKLAPQWAVSFAALALLLLVNGYWMGQLSSLHRQQQTLEAKMLQQETALSVIAMDEMHRTILPAVEGKSLAKADVIWGEGFEIALLYVEEFPQPEAGKVYQLWLIKDGKRSSGGLFTVNQHGTGTLIIQLSQEMDEYDTLGITAEPEGGSQEPTSPPVVRGPIKG